MVKENLFQSREVSWPFEANSITHRKVKNRRKNYSAILLAHEVIWFGKYSQKKFPLNIFAAAITAHSTETATYRKRIKNILF